ncbi:MAG: ribosomal protein S18P -alanine acetyltransferase [Frankiales bacterium]|nr:ribosomal protein S18P -alanine acetyltransferase [Frankiales bacterium]
MVTLARFRWWHVDQVVPVERVLFPDEPWSARLFWSELGQVDTRHYLVALDGADVVGYAGLCDYPDEAFVQTMAVAPSAQGAGLGARLLEALLEEAARRGHRTTSLEVRADNEPAQRLYARYGFAQDGVRRGYYKGSAQGERTDAWTMTRRA